MNGYKSFAVTVIGGNHIKNDISVCQDASNFYPDESVQDENVSIAVVADGHGDSSCFRSHLGAKFAVECATRGIQEFVKQHEALFAPKKKITDYIPRLQKQAASPLPTCNEFEKLLREQLIRYTIASWNKAVGEHYEKNLFSEDELEKVSEKYRKRFEAAQQKFQANGVAEGINKAYGTTLIAAAITPHYWFGFHIGDGRFTVLYPGHGDQPVPWDEKCYLNVTTSICDDDILERDKGVRSFLSFHSDTPPPIAIYLCTDGIDDNYPADEEENKTQLIKLYRTISLAFADDGYESTCAQLKDLAYEFATKGKGDDTTIAGIINIEEIKKAALDYKWKEKMEAAEEERDRKKAEEAENEASGEASHAEDDTGKPIAGPADTGFKPTAEPEVSTLAGNNRAASRAYEKTMSTKI